MAMIRPRGKTTRIGGEYTSAKKVDCLWEVWATKSEDVGLIVRAISFQHFQPIAYATYVQNHNNFTASNERKMQYKLERTASLNIVHFSKNIEHVGLRQCSGNLHGN